MIVLLSSHEPNPTDTMCLAVNSAWGTILRVHCPTTRGLLGRNNYIKRKPYVIGMSSVSFWTFLHNHNRLIESNGRNQD